MEDTTYNGWSNRATWLVNVWFSPQRKDLDWIREELEERVDQLANSADSMNKCLADIINLNDIDWIELRETLEDESDDE